MEQVILKVEELKKHFPVRKGITGLFSRKREYVHAVDGINFEIKKGELLGLVGESGCGKTTAGRVILRLIEPTGGKIYFDGQEVTSMKRKNLQQMRQKMQILFQDPYESLDPRMQIVDILTEPLSVHRSASSKNEKREIVESILETVGLTPPEEFVRKFPHELSGGERQRVAIGRVLVLKPSFLVADEPVSMLDASTKAGIVKLMLTLRESINLSQLFITHDLAVAWYICHRIAVMYLGKIVEIAPSNKIIDEPAHPYTNALISALPLPDPTAKTSIQMSIKGEVPDAVNPPSGCRLHPRCPYTEDVCRRVEPELIDIGRHHYVACHKPRAFIS